MLIRTLQDCLDEASLSQIRLLKEQGGQPSFKLIWDSLCRIHGYDPTFQNRQAWEAVRLHMGGPGLTKREFLLFHSQFLIARNRVADRSESQEYSLILAQLPQYWKEAQQREEFKLRRHKYWVRVEASGLGLSAVTEFFQDCLESERVKVEDHSGFYLVECTSERLQTRAIKLDGWNVEENTIHVTSATRRMTAPEILDWMLESLTYNEESSDHYLASDHRGDSNLPGGPSMRLRV